MPNKPSMDGDRLYTKLMGLPLFWEGHLCEGSQLALGHPDTFCIWTRCQRRDVPAGAARLKEPTDEVTCQECIAVAQAEADHGTGALSAEAALLPRKDP